MSDHNARTGDVTVLNTLIATLIDSVEGYEKSAGDVENPRFSELFNSRARERQGAVEDLRAAVRVAGGEPEDDGSVLGSAHRVFLSLKEAVTGRDDKAIVNEIERGEDYLKGKFRAALENTDLGVEARAAVQSAWDSVRAGHDEMSALKHSMDV
ncbi:MAG: PA2169 family four-helix-bundle protein [Novosphingobium sp.]